MCLLKDLSPWSLLSTPTSQKSCCLFQQQLSQFLLCSMLPQVRRPSRSRSEAHLTCPPSLSAHLNACRCFFPLLLLPRLMDYQVSWLNSLLPQSGAPHMGLRWSHQQISSLQSTLGSGSITVRPRTAFMSRGFGRTTSSCRRTAGRR